MKIIKEIGSQRGNYYKVYMGEIEARTIRITRVKREKDGKIYFILIDTKGRIIEPVYEFLNKELMNKSVNSREQAASALKILYSYKEIINKPIESFDKQNFDELSDLILGRGIEKDKETKVYTSDRGISTHNLYFDTYRKLYRYLGINSEFLFSTQIAIKERGTQGLLGHIKEIKVERYETNKTHQRRSDRYVPKYISYQEYRTIKTYMKSQKEVREDLLLRNSVIIDLMYMNGLRLGEVLGLTLEDIITSPDASKGGWILIRNRVTDKKYQKAKTCLGVSDSMEYQSKRYNTPDVGYYKIAVGAELLKDIKQYISISRNPIYTSDKVFDNIEEYAQADSVEGNKKNEYVFLSKDGRYLSSAGWNKFLRGLLEQVGLIVDKNLKENNLSHRFRHGYAMYLIEVEKRSIEYVQKKMRHRSIRSTLVYYNPTEKEVMEDTIKMETQVRRDLSEAIKRN